MISPRTRGGAGGGGGGRHDLRQDEGRGREGLQQPAAAAADLVDDAAPDADQEGTGLDQEAAGTEWDIIRHVFSPLLGWRVIGAISTEVSRSARTGVP